MQKEYRIKYVSEATHRFHPGASLQEVEMKAKEISEKSNVLKVKIIEIKKEEAEVKRVK